MKRYMLDTNAVSALIKQQPAVVKKVCSLPMHALYISAITEGELRFGLAKRPEATRLHQAVLELLKRVDVLPWDHSVTQTYGTVRAGLEAQGKTLGALDLLIASHALSTDAVLVSNDRVFRQVSGLIIEDWVNDD